MTARVASVDLARYVAPGRALARPHGLVVRLHVTAAATEPAEVVGVGEAVVAGDRTEPAWRELRALAAGVVGADLPDRPDPARPLSGVAGFRPVAATDPGARRSAKLALEMALLDAVGKRDPGAWPAAAGAAAAPVGRQPVYPLPATVAEGLPEPLACDSGAAWAVKLRLTGDDGVDLEWLRRVVAHERAAGRDRPLWLVGGERSAAAAARFVTALAALRRDGELPERVLLEEPLARGRQSRLAKLRQRSVLARVPRRSPLRALHRAGGGVCVVAGDQVASPAQAAALARGVGGLHLSPAAFSSLLGLREAARAAKRANPAVTVLLAGERGSGVTDAALAALAAATPEIDRYVPEPLVGAWPVLAAAPAAAADPGDAAAAPASGVDLAELATVADELATVPEVPVPPAAETPNRFPDYPLGGAALAVRSMLLETEALRAGLRTRRLARDFFLVEHPATGEVGGFFDSESTATSFAAATAAADKGVTRELLSRAGLPVPAGAAFPAGDRDRAYRAGLELGFPLVVKPAGGSKGTAVTVGVTTAAELAKALDEVVGSKYADTGIVVERQVAGDDYRVLATRDEVLSVVRREPASVVGDGRHTVAELVLWANVARRHNPHLAKRLIVLDARVDDQLRRQSLTRRSVPAAGQRVWLRAEANLSLGGDSREVRGQAHPSLRELAAAAVAAIPGLPYAGLDILLEDHRRPVADQPVSILEVNSRPVQSLHHFPMYGPPRNVSARLVADTARAAGWPVADPGESLTVRAVVTGRTEGTRYSRWLTELATQLAVSGWVSEADGRVTLLAHGAAPRVGLLLRMAFHGPAGAELTEAYAEPVDTVPPAGFKTRRRPGVGAG